MRISIYIPKLPRTKAFPQKAVLYIRLLLFCSIYVNGNWWHLKYRYSYFIFYFVPRILIRLWSYLLCKLFIEIRSVIISYLLIRVINECNSFVLQTNLQITRYFVLSIVLVYVGHSVKPAISPSTSRTVSIV